MLVPTRFDTGFDEKFNSYVIEVIKYQKSWHICDLDGKREFNENIDPRFSDTGMILTSFGRNQNPNVNLHNANLNIIADIILQVSLKSQTRYKFKNINLRRVIWNYYNKSSTGTFHRDLYEPNHCSLIYYLNTCDAFTIIDDKQYDCIAGQGVLFDSNIVHRGTGPTKSTYKYACNIVFDYEL